MRVVSYTRTTSCFPGAEISTTEITDQNQCIQAFAEKHGWKISEKYSDRKKDPSENAAFEKLLQDGMQRKFDVVIVSSVYRAGKDLWGAKEVLLQTFHYAGIGFAVVEDDYCSVGKTNAEAETYFDDKYSLLRRENIRYRVNRRNRNGVLSWNDLKYGYRLTEDYRLEIDPETAPVVRRMFELCAEGKAPYEIADIFREERIPVPLVSRGMNVEIPDPYNWDRQSVRRLLDKTVYIGHWTKVVQGEVMHFYNEPIVDKEVFQKVQDYLSSIATHAKPPRPKHRYNMLVRDKERGFCLLLRNSRYGYSYFSFASAPKGYTGKRKLLITELEDFLRKTLDAEKEKAARIARRIELEGEQKLQAILERMKSQFKQRAFLLADREQTRMAAYRKLKSGEISEEDMVAEDQAFREFAEKIEKDLTDYPKKVEKLKTAINKDNPWMNLFLTWDSSLIFDRETLVKYISMITLDHMEIASVQLINQEWFMELPADWREEHGEEK